MKQTFVEKMSTTVKKFRFDSFASEFATNNEDNDKTTTKTKTTTTTTTVLDQTTDSDSGIGE